jgi:glycosyltransferase involved in cell wall biosynthesis
MRIIIPITCSFGPQGGWRVLSELANSWIRNGHSVSFLVHKSSSLPYFPTNANILWFDNNGSICATNDVLYKMPFARYFGIVFALVKALNKQRCDIVLATLSLSALPIFLSKIVARKFYYVQAYEPSYYTPTKFINIIYNIISRSSYYLGLEIIVNSEYYFNYKGIKSSRCVHPGIDFSVFYSKDQDLVKTDKKIIIGTIGRIEKYKGTYYILEAFKKIKSELDLDIELHIAFGDEKMGQIKGVKIIKINGDVQLSNFYRSLDIYICAGTYQLGAIHYPVIESMACGIPLITTGYFPSNDENAWIVSVKSADDIVTKIKAILSNLDIAKMKSVKAIDDVKEFNWDIVSTKMIGYFKGDC